MGKIRGVLAHPARLIAIAVAGLALLVSAQHAAAQVRLTGRLLGNTSVQGTNSAGAPLRSWSSPADLTFSASPGALASSTGTSGGLDDPPDPVQVGSISMYAGVSTSVNATGDVTFDIAISGSWVRRSPTDNIQMTASFQIQDLSVNIDSSLDDSCMLEPFPYFVTTYGDLVSIAPQVTRLTTSPTNCRSWPAEECQFALRMRNNQDISVQMTAGSALSGQISGGIRFVRLKGGGCADPWTRLVTSNSPGGRNPILASTPNGDIFLFGGEGSSSGQAHNDVWKLVDTTWTRLRADEAAGPLVPRPWFSGAAAFDPLRSKLLVYMNPLSETAGSFGQLWAFDPQTLEWNLLVDNALSSTVYGMGYDAGRSVVVIRDRDGTLEFGTAGLERRSFGPSTLASAQTVLDGYSLKMFGGVGPASGGQWGQSDRLWSYEGDTGSWVEYIIASSCYSFPSQPPRPSARWGHTMGYDPERNKLIVAGGIRYRNPFPNGGTELLGDAWEAYVGQRGWASTGTIGTPRYGLPALAWDAARHRSVLYGGFDGSRFVDETWVRQNRQIRVLSPASPMTLRLTPASPLRLSVEVDGVTGAPVYSAQWRKNGVALTNGGRYSGVGTFALVISNATDADHGVYDCILRSCGTISVTSPTVSVFCAADFNSSGSVSVQDIFDFLAAWFAGCTSVGPAPCQNGSADVNGTTGLTVQDIFDFLGAWFAGCV